MVRRPEVAREAASVVEGTLAAWEGTVGSRDQASHFVEGDAAVVVVVVVAVAVDTPEASASA